MPLGTFEGLVLHSTLLLTLYIKQLTYLLTYRLLLCCHRPPLSGDVVRGVGTTYTNPLVTLDETFKSGVHFSIDKIKNVYFLFRSSLDVRSPYSSGFRERTMRDIGRDEKRQSTATATRRLRFCHD